MKFDELLKLIKSRSTESKFKEIIDNIKSLNVGQRNALHISLDTLYNTNKSICISGAAGTGKTFLTKVLLQLLESMYNSSKIVLAAPTHQSKKVLAENSGKDAYTIHSLFRILPNLKEDNRSFESVGKDLPKLKDILFLVIDEVSMIDEDLFKIIYQKLPMHTKIIALGDPYQLAPINSNSISKFFTHKDFVQVRLTEIMRQKEGSPIIDQADKIRNRKVNSLYNDNNSGFGVFEINTEKEFISRYLEHVKSPEDALSNKIIAYTNNSVNMLNNYIRSYIYQTKDQLINGEYLVLQSAVIIDNSLIFNNGENIEVIKFEEKNQRFEFNISNDSINVKYYKVKVQSLDTGEIGYINIIFDEYLDEFNFKLHCEASQLKMRKIKNPKSNLGLFWKDWWEIKEFFTEVKSIFASTVHKIQGTTLDNCFVYQKDFSKASLEDNYYQLLYVAITRAKNNIYFI